MKIRAGFVSNSSSSAFVVVFPQEPKSAEEVRKIMFGDALFISNPYNDDTTKTSQIAKTVWQDLKPQRHWKSKTRTKKIGQAIRGGQVKGQPKYDDFKVIPNHIKELEYAGEPVLIAKIREQIDWEAYGKSCDEYAKRTVKNLLKVWASEIVYIFYYGDEDGEYYSTLEHGGIFYKLPHKRISYH